MHYMMVLDHLRLGLQWNRVQFWYEIYRRWD